jgi:hypothetical protein
MSLTAALPRHSYDSDAGVTASWKHEESAPTQRQQRAVGQVVVDRHDGLEKSVGKIARSETEQYFSVPELRPVQSRKVASFSVAKEWEGSVDAIGISHFTAQLRETRGADDATDFAELPIADIPPLDRDRLREGAIFRYLIGYAQDSHGTVTRKRLVYFRKGKLKPKVDVQQSWLDMAAMFSNDHFTG